jgi:hypothetical protein
MKKAEITSSVSRAINNLGFKLKKYSPEILVAAGVAGTVVSAVLACKATTKVSIILEKAKEDVDAIHDCTTNENLTEEYTSEDAKKDIIITYTQTVVQLAKLYAPAVALGMLSLGSILTSNNILRKRNIALAAAYVAVDKGFKEYRGRVIERFGGEIDRELKYNIKAKTFEENVIDEKGKEKTVKTPINIADPNTYSDYARFFDESCAAWEKDSEYNLMVLRAQQQYANDLLKAKGRLFLNEVYDLLGIKRSKAGQVVGWVYDPNNPFADNFVDFGIYDMNRETVRDFVNGYERVILLDFNVDGNIWESM